MNPLTQAEVIQAMRDCRQTPTQTVLEHGESVHSHFMDLYSHLEHGTALHYEWRLPSWLKEHGDRILDCLLSLETLRTYQIYHDCGKPFCASADEYGGSHFQNHAKISSDIWRAAGGSEQSARLMAMDMDAHTIKADGYPEFANREEAWSLWLTALSEIHSNAEMFGGIQSDSFKIKWKRLEKLGRYLLQRLQQP